MSQSKFKMSISLNVLNHLGRNLCRNTAAVIAGVIANAWDADATEVRIDYDRDEKSVTVSDNGFGMTRRILTRNISTSVIKKEPKRAKRSLHRAGGPWAERALGNCPCFPLPTKSSFKAKRAGRKTLS